MLLSRAKLEQLIEKHQENFHASEPYPYVVIDDFLPIDEAIKIAESFPDKDQINWRLAGPGDSKHTQDPNIEKITSSDEEAFPKDIRQAMYSLQSGIFIRFLEKLTGFEHLNADPHHFGCGLHSTGSGGRLMLHVDASRHPNKDFQQLINLIYYCTPDWKEEYGGHLELWDKEAKQCVKKITPSFNRAVIFYTGRDCYHGQPEPTTSPKNIRRNSLALYFYSTKKSQSDLPYTNFVNWKAVNKHDNQSLYYVGKKFIRNKLPHKFVNVLVSIKRRFN